MAFSGDREWRIGTEIARVLKVKVYNHKDHLPTYDTTRGYKSAVGIYRAVREIIAETK